MNKKVIILKEDGKIVDVCEVVTFTDFAEYKKVVDEAKKNKEEIEKAKAESQAHRDKVIDGSIVDLQDNLIARGWEIDMLRGKITEEEYERRVNELWNNGTN